VAELAENSGEIAGRCLLLRPRGSQGRASRRSAAITKNSAWLIRNKFRPSASLYNEAYPMFIRTLKLQNVLSFRESDLVELRALNILIGPNGSGKSNLIECIELLHWLPQSLNRFLGQRGGADAWLWKGRGSGDGARIAGEFELDKQKLYYDINFGDLEGALVIQSEALTQANEGHTPVYLVRVPGNFKIADAKNIVEGQEATISRFESAFEAYRNPLDPTPITRVARAFGEIRVYRTFDTGADSSIRTGISAASPKHPLDPNGSNLALVLQEMDFHGSLRSVKAYLSELSNRFEDIKIRPEGGRSQLYVQERGVGNISATRLSDGTLKFLCLIAALFDHDPPRLICIDEPEAGLHPDAVKLVADAVRVASSRMQVIVTTHSDAFVDRFTDEPENVIVCERTFDESTRLKRLSRDQLSEWLEEYTLGDLWRRGEIGGTLQ
jgi:predicted ATPase